MGSCERCVFWDRMNDHVGECRRYPPRIGPNDEPDGPDTMGPHTAVWPITFADEWCGEWAAAEEVSFR